MTPAAAVAFSLLHALVFGTPLFMFARKLPRKSGYRARFALGCLLLLADSVVSSIILKGNQALELLASDVASFSLTLGTLVAVTMLCHEASIWTALFCSTSAYAVQNLGMAGSRFVLLLLTGASGPSDVPSILVLSVASTASSLLVCYLAFVRKMERRSLALVSNGSMLLGMALVVMVSIVFSSLLGKIEGTVQTSDLVILCAVHVLSCVGILFVDYELLYNRTLRLEQAASSRLMAERERQYELSRRNVDAINIKCHDIRHQIRSLSGRGQRVDESVLDDIAGEVSIYDATYQTGNAPLDTILTEKALVCQQNGIDFTCMADGSALSCLEPAQIYSLFGNILDNAIEASLGIGEKGRRSVSLIVKRVGSMTSVHEENYYAGMLSFVDGLPETTKGDTSRHGFGMRSIRATAEACGGSMSAGTHGDVFFVDLLIP